MPNSLQPHGLQHARPPSLSPSLPKFMSIELVMPSNHLILSALFSCPQSFPASGSFPVSQLFASRGQSIGASTSASVLPVSFQGWFPLELTGLISLLSIRCADDTELLWVVKCGTDGNSCRNTHEALWPQQLEGSGCDCTKTIQVTNCESVINQVEDASLIKGSLCTHRISRSM